MILTVFQPFPFVQSHSTFWRSRSCAALENLQKFLLVSPVPKIYFGSAAQSATLTLMDVIFNCPKCGQELEVDASGTGEEITCPACSQKILIPDAAGGARPVEGAGEPAPASGWGAPAKNVIAQSAAAKIERHLKVPSHSTPSAALITKPAVPLEVTAKESDRQLRVKSIRHIDCVEVGHDKFDDIVGKFLAKIGEHNLVSVTPLAYSHLDIASQKQLTDYGVLIIYKG